MSLNAPRPIFLTAEWRNLAILNFTADPGILQPYVPAGTEFDLFHRLALISLVGFQFQKTRIKGVAIPFHRDFEEINLRFYVKRRHGGELRRGVVFVKEIVPKAAIAWVARTLYGENYVALPMRHDVVSGTKAEYSCHAQGRWNHMRIQAIGEPGLPAVGSLEHFIIEHYWGYARQQGGGTMEYKVEHPSWRVWPVKSAEIEWDTAGMYGNDLASALSAPVHSAVLAEGSAVIVRSGARLLNQERSL